MQKNLKILVLEDMEDDLELIEYTLRKADLQFVTRRVDTREEYINALKEKDTDVILSDHFLPQFNSQEALALYREAGLQIPFILVTGAISEEFAVNTLKQGADDYVLKSNLTRLPNAIINALKQREAEAEKMQANNVLREQYDELIKINKELDSFVYSVSHNLRAPLRSVLGLVGLAKMEDEERGNYFSNYFKMMEDSMYKLDETLKEILDYSRNARQDINLDQVDIKKLVNENIERMQYMPGASKIKKEITIEEDFPLLSDKYRISFIVNNLVSNAIKYYDPTKPNPFLKISIKITADRVFMEFKDNGIGIDKAYISKVFDMFFRATQHNDGAGLGLYIVREAVEKLKGEIIIESEIGVGTTFKIQIPNLHRNQLSA
jgi:signal transduction histidine kinase